MILPLLDWPSSVLLAGLGVSLGAGFVRGFAGFGYSALTVAGLALFVAPGAVVPAVLALEILASISLWRSALRQADRGWLRWLLAGNMVFVPLGLTLLALLPATTLRLLVSTALFMTAVALRLAYKRSLAPTRALKSTAGMASGLLNGLAASGGVAAAMLLAAAHVPPVRLRATMVIFLLVASAYALICAALMSTHQTAGLITWETVNWVVLLAPSMLAGIWLGHRAFAIANVASHRQHVLTLLLVISALGMLRAGADLWLR